jgi:putative tricarboxylic transport membrane protein
MRKREFWAALFWGLLGGLIAVKSISYKVGSLGNPGPGFLPFWVGICIILLSLCSVINNFRLSASAPSFFEGKGAFRRLGLTLVSIFAYILVISRVGFLLSTLLLLGFLLKSIYPQTWTKTVIFAALGSLFSYFVFQYWLQVQLPKGLIPF